MPDADRTRNGSSASPALADVAASAPERPGCYLFRAGSGRILYVGKARILRRRLLSYFQKNRSRSPRTEAMLDEAARIEVILCASEVEALILENSLIKKNRPRYNILLRDDKNFPYLKLTVRDPFPRVVLVRRPRMDGQLYYGPYTPASVARRSLKMVARFFQVATCTERFDGSRLRPCLLHQLDQCLAPCVDSVNAEAYRAAVADVRLFLEGRNKDLRVSLKARMEAASATLAYERAAHYRDLMSAVAALGQKQSVASVGLEDQDYFGLHRDGGRAALQVFEMRGGLIQSRREFFLDDVDGEDGELLAGAIGRYYSGAPLVPERIFTSSPPAGTAVLSAWLRGVRGGAVSIHVPQRGTHRQMMQTVLDNARLAWDGRFAADHTFGVEVLEALRVVLGLDEVPVRIEGFDVSHVQGTDTVASVVVFEGGRPKRSDYRRLRLEDAGGGDDYAAMREAVTRRYRRRVAEGSRLPDLILVDGGRGQLAAACRALSSQGVETLPILALAKQREEVFLPGRDDPLRLPETSPARHLLTRVRDEAHRFAVAYHRTRRRRRTLATDLTRVAGIGPRRARRLLREFGSVAGVKAAGEEELSRVLGPVLAGRLRRELG
ncbi:MAG: excinuclease ABC subunit UvrC [Acidobacteriota bacterium]